MKVELSNVTTNGMWILVGERELFLSFNDFPWFEDAPIRALAKIEQPRQHHLYWPELDIDLSVESIGHPERYPLVSRARPKKTMPKTGLGTVQRVTKLVKTADR